MDTEPMQKSNKSMKALGVFSLAMINCAAVINLRNLTSMAEYGLSMVFFYAFAILLFLLPVSLVSAELATGFTENGGLFDWVRKAMGDRLGFLAIWLDFVGNVVGFPATMTYLASLFAHAMGRPDIAESGYYVLSVITFITFIGTFVGLKGMRLASVVTNFGFIFGTIIPGFIIIFLGVSMIFSGNDSCIPLGVENLIPQIDSIDKFALLPGVLLGFAGLEISSFHAQDVDNPQKNYPRSIFISMALIFGLSLLGSLAIAISVPKETLTLQSGVIQCIESLFSKFNFPAYMTRVTALLISFGAFAGFVTWISGPARGVLATSKTGILPPFLQKVNKQGMPSSILIWQAVAIVLSSSIFLLAPSIQTGFWILLAITAQSALVMYILMFLSGIILKFKHPEVKRAYTVPFGNLGMILICVVAIITCTACYFIGFIRPEEIEFENDMLYLVIMILGNIIIMSPPFILSFLKKPDWENDIQGDFGH